MTFPTCSAFSLAALTSPVSWPSCLFALLNCLPALPICLARPSIPPPVPGTFTPSTRLGLRANLLPISAPPTRPATVPAPASSVVAPFEAAPPPDDPDPPPFLEAALRAEAPDPALFARFVELDACLLREAELREPPPLRELLDFARVPLDFARVPLELA